MVVYSSGMLKTLLKYRSYKPIQPLLTKHNGILKIIECLPPVLMITLSKYMSQKHSLISSIHNKTLKASQSPITPTITTITTTT
jgi:hypothetical protein